MKAILLNAALDACELGEGPCWDAAGGYLYWVDITGRRLHRARADGRGHAAFTVPSAIGFAVMDKTAGLVIGLKDGVYRFAPDSGALTPLIGVAENPENRFNDGKCDPRGRLWAGTMHACNANHMATGALYRFDGQRLHQQETGVHISNGLGWSPDNRTMYYSDTVARVVWRYDYDLETGTASNRRVFARFDGAGRPDGICVDSAGRVLVALWPGYGIEIFNPDGAPDGRIDLPVPQVSSCAFGGDDLKTLFITTAYEGMSDQARAAAPLSGHLFVAQMDVPGLPVASFAGREA